jgi:hypothetical protein
VDHPVYPLDGPAARTMHLRARRGPSFVCLESVLDGTPKLVARPFAQAVASSFVSSVRAEEVLGDTRVTRARPRVIVLISGLPRGVPKGQRKGRGPVPEVRSRISKGLGLGTLRPERRCCLHLFLSYRGLCKVLPDNQTRYISLLFILLLFE